MRPGAFEGHEEASEENPLTRPDGEPDYWDFPQIPLRGRVHPRQFVGVDMLALLNLWLLCRGGEFSPSRLPFAGGVAEQSCWIMAAFDVFDGVAAALKPKR